MPKTPMFEVAKGTKIGYDIELDEKIAHVHYGTTAFNNINKEYPKYNWSLNEFADKEAQRLIKKYSFEPVKVDGSQLPKLEDFANEKQKQRLANGKSISLNAEQEAAMRAARQAKLNEMGLSALVRLKSIRNSVYVECGNYGCTDFYADHPGFFSRGVLFFKPNLNAALPSVSSAYIVKPEVTVIGDYNAFDQLEPMKDFKPVDFKNMNDNEWAEVETALKKLITETLERDIKSIYAGSDGEGGVLRKLKE